MERYAPVLLEVWREVCRHIRIGESLERVAPILARRLPADLILVRRIDLARSCVETVGEGLCRPAALPNRAKTEASTPDLERLLVWCRRGEVARHSIKAANKRLAGLVPGGLIGEIVAGPLNAEEGQAGVLLLAAQPPHAFRTEHEELVQALLEPFTVALENDRRLHELSSLREAVEADNRSLLSRLDRHDISESIIGAETGLRPVMEQIELVARSDTPVLILGETGSGKEVVARAIHTRSKRALGPFLRVNCGAIPPDLVDSELFGHERGSFTGAVAGRKGWFERADGGTLFLDECGELPVAAQVRLLRVLQDGMLERVGGERSMHVDVRIVAATHRDLQAWVTDGRFREDLWYRIAVFPIRLPPLRDRPTDIPSLAAHFALRAAKRLGMPPLAPSAADVSLLVSYAWPGNVRELSAVIERAAILGGGDRLDVARALGAAPVRSAASAQSRLVPEPRPASNDDFPTLDVATARHIEAALQRTRGRVEGPFGVAALLAINPHTLRARMRKLGVRWKEFRI